VEFRDGIREWFDVVVDAGGGDDALRSAGVTPPASDPLAQYEISIDTDTPTRSKIRDYWRSDTLVQTFHSPDGSGSTLRITTPHSDVGRVLDDADWDAVLPNGTDTVPEYVEFEETSVRQASASDAAADWWGAGQVAFCGPAAYPVAPASGFNITLGIEDAIAFVTELTKTTRHVPDSVDTYSSRRANRLSTLRDTIETVDADHQYPTPRSTRPPLASLGTLRGVTLGSFLGGPMASLQRDGFRTN
jgi:2-polyprenyl-6-methoxyphenol hydroxylase-like FAD-dependent oxidoreductase